MKMEARTFDPLALQLGQLFDTHLVALQSQALKASRAVGGPHHKALLYVQDAVAGRRQLANALRQLGDEAKAELQARGMPTSTFDSQWRSLSHQLLEQLQRKAHDLDQALRFKPQELNHALGTVTDRAGREIKAKQYAEFLGRLAFNQALVETSFVRGSQLFYKDREIEGTTHRQLLTALEAAGGNHPRAKLWTEVDDVPA